MAVLTLACSAPEALQPVQPLPGDRPLRMVSGRYKVTVPQGRWVQVFYEDPNGYIADTGTLALAGAGVSDRVLRLQGGPRHYVTVPTDRVERVVAFKPPKSATWAGNGAIAGFGVGLLSSLVLLAESGGSESGVEAVAVPAVLVGSAAFGALCCLLASALSDREETYVVAPGRWAIDLPTAVTDMGANR